MNMISRSRLGLRWVFWFQLGGWVKKFILTYILCIDTSTFDKFGYQCYKYIFIWFIWFVLSNIKIVNSCMCSNFIISIQYIYIYIFCKFYILFVYLTIHDTTRYKKKKKKRFTIRLVFWQLCLSYKLAIREGECKEKKRGLALGF